MKFSSRIVLLFVSMWVVSSCETEELVSEELYIPTDVLVRISETFGVEDVFEFINSQPHQVEYVSNQIYVSDLTGENFDAVMMLLESKPYINHQNREETGFIHNQTNQIVLFPKLYNIKNEAYQQDWLNTMEELSLYPMYNGHLILFNVPQGTELEWVGKFLEYDFVVWASLNYVR